MSHSHFEPFLHLVDVTSDRALVAWGGFFFERAETGQRWRTVFDRAGVRAAFAGHEHNFQFCRVDGISYVTTGAGGKVREEPPSDFAAAGAVAWAAQAHCLLVEITGDRLAITPVAAVGSDGELEVMTALSPEAQVVPPPFVVTAP